MTPEKQAFLNLKRLPAVLNREEAAWLLGWEQPLEVSIVTSAGHLHALGNPAPNAKKLYASSAVEKLRDDVKWLDKARVLITRYWKVKNSHRRDQGNSESQPQE